MGFISTESTEAEALGSREGLWDSELLEELRLKAGDE
jgi:hypothetical protein